SYRRSRPCQVRADVVAAVRGQQPPPPRRRPRPVRPGATALAGARRRREFARRAPTRRYDPCVGRTATDFFTGADATIRPTNEGCLDGQRLLAPRLPGRHARRLTAAA